MIGFYMKCDTGLKWAKICEEKFKKNVCMNKKKILEKI